MESLLSATLPDASKLTVETPKDPITSPTAHPKMLRHSFSENRVLDPNAGPVFDVDTLSLNPTDTIRQLSSMLRRAYYKELVVYVGFLITLAVVLGTMIQVSTPFTQGAGIVELVFQKEFNRNDTHIFKTFSDVGQTVEFWQWIEGPLLRNILSDQIAVPRNICETTPHVSTPISKCVCGYGKGEDNNKCRFLSVPPTECSYEEHFVNSFARLVGPIRMRQLRLKARACQRSTNPAFQCRSATYASSPFGPNCSTTPTSLSSTFPCYTHTDTVGWRIFRPELDPGYTDIGEYPEDGGFVVDLFPERSMALATVETLRTSGYVDTLTKSVEISFNLYNAETNFLSAVEAMFLFDSSGFIDKNYRVYPIHVNPYNENRSIKVLFEVIWVIFVGYFVVVEIREMLGTGWAYLRDFWNYVEWISLILFIVLIASWIDYLRLLNDLDFDPDNYCTFQNAIAVGRGLRLTYLMSGLTVFFAITKVNKFLKFNPRLHVLWRTLLNAAADIVAFLVIFFLIFYGFAAWGHYGFGPYLADFHTVGATSSTLFRWVMGDLDYKSMVVTNPFLAPVFLGTYGMTVVFIVVNVFIAIVSEWHLYSKGMNAKEHNNRPQAEDAVDFDLLKQLGRWWSDFKAFKVYTTRPITLSAGQVFKLDFRMKRFEATETKAAVMSQRLLSLLNVGDVIQFKNGLRLTVETVAATSVGCTVSAPGTFVPSDSISVIGRYMTSPGFPTVILRTYWNIRDGIFDGLRHVVRVLRREQSVFGGRDVLSALVKAKDQLGLRMEIRMRTRYWTQQYRTSHGHSFSLKDLLFVMRKCVLKSETTLAANPPSITFHELVDLLLNYQLSRNQGPSVREIFHELYQKLRGRGVSTTASRSKIDTAAYQPRVIELMLTAPPDETEDYYLHVHSVIEANLVLQDDLILDMAELAFAIILRFGVVPRAVQHHSLDFDFGMTPRKSPKPTTDAPPPPPPLPYPTLSATVSDDLIRKPPASFSTPNIKKGDEFAKPLPSPKDRRNSTKARSVSDAELHALKAQVTQLQAAVNSLLELVHLNTSQASDAAGKANQMSGSTRSFLFR